MLIFFFFFQKRNEQMDTKILEQDN